jgi:hypothetical protein
VEGNKFCYRIAINIKCNFSNYFFSKEIFRLPDGGNRSKMRQAEDEARILVVLNL